MGSLQWEDEHWTKKRGMRDAHVGDVGLNKTKHLLGRLRDLNENTVVDLEKTEELKNFAGLRRDVVDTEETCLGMLNDRKRNGLTPGYG